MAVLRVTKGARAGAVFPVFSSRQPTILGRDAGSDVALEDPRASRRHASIYLEEGGWLLEDLDSRNGTAIGNQRLKKAALRDGAVIRIGATALSFHASDLLAPPAIDFAGWRPLESLREEAGVFVFRSSRQARVDWFYSSRGLTAGLAERLARAVRTGQAVQVPGLRPILAADLEAAGGLYVVIGGLPKGTLEEKLPLVLDLPLRSRLRMFRRLVELALERARGETTWPPMAMRHIDVEWEDGREPQLLLPPVEIGAFAAEETGSLGHLRPYLAYLPPEAQDPASGQRSPSLPPLAGLLYNLGALGYHLLTRVPPAGEGEAKIVLANQRTLRPAPPSVLDAEIPADVSALLERLLEKEPDRRPGVEEVLASLPASSAPAPAPTTGAAPRPGPAPASAASAPKRQAPDLEAVGPEIDSPSRRLLYLPLWTAAWVLLFFAARWLSRLLFERLES